MAQRRLPITDSTSWSVEAAYLALALTIGALLVILMPPFQNNDEADHYFRAWAVADGQWLASDHSSVWIPLSVATLNAELFATEVTQEKLPYSPRLSLDYLRQPITEERLDHFTSAGNYSPFGYLPQAGAIRLLELARGSPLLGLYAARLANLLTNVLLCYLAIRAIPYGKALLALIALLPMTVSLSASVNPNSLLFSAVFLFTAAICRFGSSDRLSWRHVIALASLVGLGFSMKPGYAPMALLVLAIPWRAWRAPRIAVTAWVSCLAAAVVSTALLFAAAPDASAAAAHAAAHGQVVDAGGQIAFLLNHPLDYVQTLARTYGERTLVLADHAVGLLGRGSVPISDLVMLVVAACAVVFAADRGDRSSLRAWQRWVFLGTVVGTVLALSTAMYVAWNPVGAPVVDGLQGRYFLPLVPAFLIGISGARLSPRSRVAILVGAVLAIFTLTLLAVIRRYY